MQRIKKAYAENGDLKIIPETPPLDGSENWEQGRGAYYELDNNPNTGDPLALDIDREQDNFFKNVISKNIKHWQENAYPIWFDDIKYPKNATVNYTDGNTYVSKVDKNTALPTDTNSWVNFENLGSDRIGMIDYAYVAKAYHIVAFGGEFNRADYPKLWAYLQANPTLVKTQAQWTTEATANGGICGFFSDGNGTTTFRVPNLDKAFLRPDSRGIGSFQKGTLVTWDMYPGSGATGVFSIFDLGDVSTTRETIGADTYLVNQYTSESRTVKIAGLNATTNIDLPGASESAYSGISRPKNIAVLPLIVAK